MEHADLVFGLLSNVIIFRGPEVVNPSSSIISLAGSYGVDYFGFFVGSVAGVVGVVGVWSVWSVFSVCSSSLVG